MANRLVHSCLAILPLVLLAACSSRPVVHHAKAKPAAPQAGERVPGLYTETLRSFPDYDAERAYRPSTSRDVFPRPRELEPQIRFWHKTYAGWTRSQVAIHDKQYMDIVYEVFTLPGYVAENLNPEQKDFIQERMSYWRNRLGDLADKLSAGVRLRADEQHLINQMAQNTGDRMAIYGAAQRLRYQRGLRERFKRGLAIGSRYERRFREIFRNAGLPEDLAYLPHVESSFQANAHSSAGALGIWQFTAGAARIFMNGDDSVETRLDPIASTYGAARYLGSAYDKLGSWPLAITSYNHGIGGMQRAKRRFGVDFPSIVKHYDSPQFGFASRNYYAEFLAALDIARDPGRFFPDGPSDEGGAVSANAGMLLDAFAPQNVESTAPRSSLEIVAKEATPVATAEIPQPLAAPTPEPNPAPSEQEIDSSAGISSARTDETQEPQAPSETAIQPQVEIPEPTPEDPVQLADVPDLHPAGQQEVQVPLEAMNELPTEPEEPADESPNPSIPTPTTAKPKAQGFQPSSKVTHAARVDPKKAVPSSSKPPARLHSTQSASSAPAKSASNKPATALQPLPKQPSKTASAVKEKLVKPVSSGIQRTVQPKTAARSGEPKIAVKNAPLPVASGHRTERLAADTHSKALQTSAKRRSK